MVAFLLSGCINKRPESTNLESDYQEDIFQIQEGEHYVISTVVVEGKDFYSFDGYDFFDNDLGEYVESKFYLNHFDGNTFVTENVEVVKKQKDYVVTGIDGARGELIFFLQDFSDETKPMEHYYAVLMNLEGLFTDKMDIGTDTENVDVFGTNQKKLELDLALQEKVDLIDGIRGLFCGR